MFERFDARLEEAADEMRARDVEIGEICAVGFVEIVVAFCERRVGGGDYGEEER